jgi:hypothetical protein
MASPPRQLPAAGGRTRLTRGTPDMDDRTQLPLAGPLPRFGRYALATPPVGPTDMPPRLDRHAPLGPTDMPYRLNYARGDAMRCTGPA